MSSGHSETESAVSDIESCAVNIPALCKHRSEFAIQSPDLRHDSSLNIGPSRKCRTTLPTSSSSGEELVDWLALKSTKAASALQENLKKRKHCIATPPRRPSQYQEIVAASVALKSCNHAPKLQRTGLEIIQEAQKPNATLSSYWSYNCANLHQSDFCFIKDTSAGHNSAKLKYNSKQQDFIKKKRVSERADKACNSSILIHPPSHPQTHSNLQVRSLSGRIISSSAFSKGASPPFTNPSHFTLSAVFPWSERQHHDYISENHQALDKTQRLSVNCDIWNKSAQENSELVEEDTIFPLDYFPVISTQDLTISSQDISELEKTSGYTASSRNVNIRISSPSAVDKSVLPDQTCTTPWASQLASVDPVFLCLTQDFMSSQDVHEVEDEVFTCLPTTTQHEMNAIQAKREANKPTASSGLSRGNEDTHTRTLHHLSYGSSTLPQGSLGSYTEQHACSYKTPVRRPPEQRVAPTATIGSCHLRQRHDVHPISRACSGTVQDDLIFPGLLMGVQGLYEDVSQRSGSRTISSSMLDFQLEMVTAKNHRPIQGASSEKHERYTWSDINDNMSFPQTNAVKLGTSFNDLLQSPQARFSPKYIDDSLSSKRDSLSFQKATRSPLTRSQGVWKNPSYSRKNVLCESSYNYHVAGSQETDYGDKDIDWESIGI